MYKEVILKSISLENFKGIKDLTVNFDERSTTISGRNASGKTTIFDAFTWCLFGKDSSGRSDTTNGGFMVKTVAADGEVIPHLEHSVTVELCVNGRNIIFTRQLVEEWGTTRGQSELRFKGNTTHYYVDGVEVNASKGEGNFESAVNDIIPENLFRQLTNPAYFPNLPWKEQRDLLLAISGDVTLSDIAEAENSKRLSVIVDEISGKNVDDYRKQLATSRKHIEDEMKLIPARISGIQMAMPKAYNYVQIEKDLAEHQSVLNGIETEMLDAASAERKKYEAIQGKQQQIYAKQSRQNEIVNAAKEKAKAEYYEANTKRREALARIDVLRKKNLDVIARTSEAKNQIASERKRQEQKLEELQKQRTDLLMKWQTRNAEVYVENVIGDCIKCPLCSDIACRNEYLLKNEADTQARAAEAWHAKQEQDLQAITAEGVELNEKINFTQSRIESLRLDEENIVELGAKDQDAISAELKQLHAYVQATPEQEAATVTATDIPEWVELQHDIAVITSEIEDQRSRDVVIDTTELQKRKAAEAAIIDELKQQLSTRQQIHDAEAKIADEQARLQELANQKAEFENKEMAVEMLVHKQSEEIERRVNSLFQKVQFRMFEKQTNGGERPTCIAMVDGVRYGDLNSAMKTNAGLDIINTFCAYSETLAPIFIDNAEGVNELQYTNSQIIRLVVSNEPLTVKEG